jgi:hypothetical protein
MAVAKPQRLTDPSGASLIGRDMDASDLERKRWRKISPRYGL